MTLINKIKKWIYSSIVYLTSWIYTLLCPMKEKKVCFLSDVRVSMGGNLEFVYNYLDDSFEKVILFKPYRGYHLTIKEQLKRIYHLTTSKYIILDDFSKTISLLKVRKGQEICQLWHGPGAFKKFGYSRLDKEFKKNDPNGHKNYTKAIVTSENIRWCYSEGFGMDIKNVLPLGMPRTDIFFDEKYLGKKKEELYNKYPLLKNKKVIMFAPTYRGNTLKDATYDFSKLDFDKLYEALHEEYTFVIKWHPGIQTVLERQGIECFDEYKDFVLNLSDYRDINDLLIISDILITDYSSVIFDYLLLNKPIVYYVYDLEEYEKERGLYFDFQNYVYGEIAKNIDELIESIKHQNLMPDKRKTFNEQFMKACDGHSTEKTCKWIFDLK